jgi:hypothetical protein
MSAGTAAQPPWDAVEAFLAFASCPAAIARAEWPELARLLDELALARWACPAPDGGDPEDAPSGPYEAVRAVVGARFPEFGFYRVVAPLRGDGELDLGCEPTIADAIDDLADVVRELQTAAWHRQHRGERNGAARLAWSFDVHWGQHLRDLQRYLHLLIGRSDTIEPRRPSASRGNA